MNKFKSEKLNEGIKSLCALTDIEEMLYALGFRHGGVYVDRASYWEVKFLEVFEESPGPYYGEIEMEFLIENCDILDRMASGDGYLLFVEGEKKDKKCLERKYVSGFILGAICAMRGYSLHYDN